MVPGAGLTCPRVLLFTSGRPPSWGTSQRGRCRRKPPPCPCPCPCLGRVDAGAGSICRSPETGGQFTYPQPLLDPLWLKSEVVIFDPQTQGELEPGVRRGALKFWGSGFKEEGGRNQWLGLQKGPPSFAKLHFFVFLCIVSAFHGVQILSLKSEFSILEAFPPPHTPLLPAPFPHPNRQFLSRMKISYVSGQLLKLCIKSPVCGEMDSEWLRVGSGLTRERVPSSPGRRLGIAVVHRRPLGYWVGGSLPELR